MRVLTKWSNDEQKKRNDRLKNKLLFDDYDKQYEAQNNTNQIESNDTNVFEIGRIPGKVNIIRTSHWFEEKTDEWKSNWQQLQEDGSSSETSDMDYQSECMKIGEQENIKKAKKEAAGLTNNYLNRPIPEISNMVYKNKTFNTRFRSTE